MKNTILVIVFIFIFNILFSQSTEIIYSIKPVNGSIENDQKIIKDGMKDAFRGVDQEFQNFEFELLINKNKSQYKNIDKLSTNRIANLIVKGISNTSNYYFIENTTISQRELFDKNYLVKIVNINPWVLVNESKKIGDYKCLKATKIRELLDGRKILITCWYASKIPLSFGPKEYHGLPGLILELSDDKVTYYVKEIKFNSKKTFDFKLDSKKIYTEIEFQNIASNLIEKSKEFLIRE